MATSPDYLRLAASSTRAQADTALDSLRDAVAAGDASQNLLPVIRANSAARRDCEATETCRHRTRAAASHRCRVAQEALTNSARRGAGMVADIFLETTPRTFLLCTTESDEGIRTQMSPYIGMRLKIMRNRASMIGAHFGIAPHAPRDTSFESRVGSLVSGN